MAIGTAAGVNIDAHAHRRGILMVAASAVLWSTAGLFVRMATLDTATLVLWRSLFAALTLGGMALVRRGPVAFVECFRDLRTTAIFVGTSVVSSTSYVFSLRLTSVANVMTVYAALPFIATGIGYVWIGEPVTRRFLLAGTIAAGGIAGMAGGSAGMGDLAGIAAALVMTAGFAIQLVAIRRHPGVDVLALNACSAAACVPVVLPFASWAVPGAVSLGAAALYGVLTTGLAYVLAMEGGRRVSPGEAGFISMLDVVLGPLWVWLAFSERPGMAVLLGGAVVLGAVGWYLGTLRGQRPVESVEERDDLEDVAVCVAD
ncbi:permease [Novosphingobium nitrogenifigens DSM 19370]|uniref:Permease n=1 Tax=Novosphingobium nitrogenifigens DSM 19370 TaxID=983920 RepID=F1ZC93_9SPHN|nr:DMT family transporter [Novosphingobium nitrogenifigens]EGD57700.1 permease [Novosphingobium nitrogenifigens DSM 19370]